MPILPDKNILHDDLESLDGLSVLNFFGETRTFLTKDRQKIQSFNEDPIMFYRERSRYKRYLNLPRIPLQVDKTILDSVSLGQTLRNRRTIRNFTGRSIPLSKLSTILVSSYGMREGFGREAPSGGARFPCEIYVFAVNVEGLQAGVYHYNVGESCLEAIAESDPNVDYGLDYIGTDLKNVSAFILITGVIQRTTVKYGSRGGRICLLDAGHLGQNIWLVSTAINVACTPSGGVRENAVSKLLNLNPLQEIPLYAFSCGDSN